MTSFLQSWRRGYFRASLECVLFQKIWFMARSIPCLTPTITQDRVSPAYTVALIPALMAGDQTPCSCADGGYLIYTNTRVVAALSLAHA